MTQKHEIVAECWTCACDGPPTCTMPHGEGDHGRMPYSLTEYRMALHAGHDVRPVNAPSHYGSCDNCGLCTGDATNPDCHRGHCNCDPTPAER
jgi:hypothetical protein